MVVLGRCAANPAPEGGIGCIIHITKPLLGDGLINGLYAARVLRLRRVLDVK